MYNMFISFPIDIFRLKILSSVASIAIRLKKKTGFNYHIIAAIYTLIYSVLLERRYNFHSRSEDGGGSIIQQL